jgi:glutathione S-transferase
MLRGMRLYTFTFAPSPLKVRFALAELGLEHERVEVNLLHWDQHSDEFKKLNPHGKVPVLEDGGFVLRESGAILQYLGKMYGHGHLWPQHPAEEALALQWLFFEACHLMAPLATLFFTERVGPLVGLPASSPDVILDNQAELERSLNVFEAQLQGRDWVMGDFSLVDCSMGVIAAMLVRTSMDQPKRWPRVFKYGERIRSRPGWAEGQGNEFFNAEAIIRGQQAQAVAQ